MEEETHEDFSIDLHDYCKMTNDLEFEELNRTTTPEFYQHYNWNKNGGVIRKNNKELLFKEISKTIFDVKISRLEFIPKIIRVIIYTKKKRRNIPIIKNEKDLQYILVSEKILSLPLIITKVEGFDEDEDDKLKYEIKQLNEFSKKLDIHPFRGIISTEETFDSEIDDEFQYEITVRDMDNNTVSMTSTLKIIDEDDNRIECDSERFLINLDLKATNEEREILSFYCYDKDSSDIWSTIDGRIEYIRPNIPQFYLKDFVAKSHRNKIKLAMNGLPPVDWMLYHNFQIKIILTPNTTTIISDPTIVYVVIQFADIKGKTDFSSSFLPTSTNPIIQVQENVHANVPFSYLSLNKQQSYSDCRYELENNRDLFQLISKRQLEMLNWRIGEVVESIDDRQNWTHGVYVQTMSNLLDFEKRQNYQLKILIKCGRRLIRMEVTIKLIDVNDNKPIFTEVPPVSYIDERNTDYEATFTCIDRDISAPYNQIRYSFTSYDHYLLDKFSLHSTSGVLKQTKKIDYEKLKFDNPSFSGIITLMISCRDQGELMELPNYPIQPQTSLITSTSLQIVVKNFNEHPPQFESTIFVKAIMESENIGTMVSLPLAFDRDGDEIHYQFLNDNDEVRKYFILNQLNNELRLYKNIDHEILKELRFTIRATDISKDNTISHSTNLMVILSIDDVNDNRPVCRPSILTIDLESKEFDGELAQIHCEDKDDHYSILTAKVDDEADKDVIRIEKRFNNFSFILNQLPSTLVSRYVITISDNGEEPLSDKVILILNNNNRNQLEILDEYSTTFLVKETTRIGSLIGKMNAIELTNSSISYHFTSELEDGNELIVIDENSQEMTINLKDFPFEILKQSGEIITKDFLDYEKYEFYKFNLTVQSVLFPGIIYQQQSYIVEVIDENDNRPKCSLINNVENDLIQISNNIPADIITEIHCFDKDKNSITQIKITDQFFLNYKPLTNENDLEEIFALDEISEGKFQLNLLKNLSLNFDEDNIIQYIILYEIIDTEKYVEKRNLKIEILKDALGIIYLSELTSMRIKLWENEPIGKKIIEFPNHSANELTISSGPLNIFANYVFLQKTLDRERESSFQQTINSPNRQMTIDVNVEDVNEYAPECQFNGQNSSLEFMTYSENEFQDNIITFSCIDRDATKIDQFKFEIFNSINELDELESISKYEGQSKFYDSQSLKIPTRYFYLSANKLYKHSSIFIPAGSYEITLTVSDNEKNGNVRTYPITIMVFPTLFLPVFQSTREEIIDLPENTDISIFLIRLEVDLCYVDPYLQLNYTKQSLSYNLQYFKFELMSDIENLFEIVDSQIIVKDYFDYEKAKSANISIKVTANIENFFYEQFKQNETIWNFIKEHESNLNILIQLSDVNDNYPQIINIPKKPLSIEEELENEISVYQFQAIDEDENDIIYFQIDDESSKTFSIDQLSGNLTTRFPIDREKTNQFIVEVIVSNEVLNSSTENLFSVYSIIINIIDINDNIPEFQRDLLILKVKEEIPLVTPLAISQIDETRAIDRDMEENAHIIYSMNNNENFEVDSTTGQIFLIKTLDREMKEFYEFEIYAQNPNKQEKNQMNVIVNVKDENDHFPQFNEREISLEIVSDNIELNKPFFQISATDKDDSNTPNGKINYFISANENFEINKFSGNIRLTSPLPNESDVILLECSACDETTVLMNRRENCTKMNLYIKIISTSSGNSLNNSTFNFTLLENSPKSFSIENSREKLSSSYKDYEFSLISSTEKEMICSTNNFRINPLTGEIIQLESIDREMDCEIIRLLVKATTKLKSIRLLINIIILDINDNLPQFPHNIQHLHFSENIRDGTLPIELAQDKDDDLLSYRMIFNDDYTRNYFALDETNSQIKLLKSLDFEEYEKFVFVIEAKENLTEEQNSVQCEIVIEVDDIDDSAVLTRTKPIFVNEILPQTSKKILSNSLNSKFIQFGEKNYVKINKETSELNLLKEKMWKKSMKTKKDQTFLYYMEMKDEGDGKMKFISKYTPIIKVDAENVIKVQSDLSLTRLEKIMKSKYSNRYLDIINSDNEEKADNSRSSLKDYEMILLTDNQIPEISDKLEFSKEIEYYSCEKIKEEMKDVLEIKCES
ncbi:hypothetical protein SNEBB_002676 [Seison nebaliae]|nr:hypothetical protein SNEBB_002676 [Seison nebaliae]